MINNAPVSVILPVADMTRATSFYRDQLGLTDAGQEPGGNQLLRSGSGTTIALMAAEEGAQSAHTAVSFEVDDIHAEIAELKSAGITFFDYDLPTLKTTDHVCVIGSEQAAWFADTEGNILCLHQFD